MVLSFSTSQYLFNTMLNLLLIISLSIIWQWMKRNKMVICRTEERNFHSHLISLLLYCFTCPSTLLTCIFYCGWFRGKYFFSNCILNATLPPLHKTFHMVKCLSFGWTISMKIHGNFMDRYMRKSFFFFFWIGVERQIEELI